MPDLIDRLNAALAGRYTVEHEVGAGGMATVYLAQDLKHQRRVAIKVMRPEIAQSLGSERFLREIQIASRLQHPHILMLIESGEADGLLFYVMPYVEGESLSVRLARECQLPLKEAVQLTREVASALSYAHEQGLIHRDIKPANIMVSAGHAVVMDFGIGRAVSVAGDARITETGVAIGTPSYMSPEQASGAPNVDARTDIYALGCVLYEMLAGEPPYTGPSAQAIVAKSLVDPVPSIRRVRQAISPAIDSVLQRALAKVPADRFATASELATTLEQAVTDPGTVRVPTKRPAVSRRSLIGIGVAGAVLVAGTVVGWMWRGQRPPATTPIERLAVLPFAALSDSLEDYVVAGVHDGLITELARMGTAAVIARSSMQRYANSGMSIREIAEELDADAVVEGSITRHGNEYRLSVHLVDASTETEQWGEQFAVALSGVLGEQERVARAILGAIGADGARPGASPSPFGADVDPEVLTAYLKGRFLLLRGTPTDLRAAQPHFERAIELDERFAPAYAQLAIVHNNAAFMGDVPPAVAFDRAKTAARQALVIDDGLASAHVQLAFALATDERDWDTAEREYRRAIDLNPGLFEAHMLYGFHLAVMGRHDEAIAEARRAQELDPVQPATLANLAGVLFVARRYDEAIARALEVIELEPNFILAYDRLADAYDMQGRYAEAIAAVDRAQAIFDGDLRRRGTLGRIYGRAGRTADAQAILDELLERSRVGYVPSVALAWLYIGLGDAAQALDWLEAAFRDGEGDLVMVNASPIYDPLRSEPRFTELLARMGFDR